MSALLQAFFSRCLTLEMSEDDARNCSRPGMPADDEVAATVRLPYIAAQLDAMDADDIRAELKECGAWDADELADDEQNRHRLVWIAACDIREALAQWRPTMPRFHVTYETVTPESAEHGEVDARGFYQPGGWKTDDAGDGMSLRDACRLIQQFKGYEPSDSRATVEGNPRVWFTSGADQDYRTGAETTYSIHPPRNTTAASARRLARLLCR